MGVINSDTRSISVSNELSKQDKAEHQPHKPGHGRKLILEATFVYHENAQRLFRADLTGTI